MQKSQIGVPPIRESHQGSDMDGAHMSPLDHTASERFDTHKNGTSLIKMAF